MIYNEDILWKFSTPKRYESIVRQKKISTYIRTKRFPCNPDLRYRISLVLKKTFCLEAENFLIAVDYGTPSLHFDSILEVATERGRRETEGQ